MTGGEYGKIFKRVWGDADFKALTCQQQLLYLKLVSQTDISLAGVLTLATIRWAGQTAGVTDKDIARTLAELEAARFIVCDRETQEVLVRSYVRNDLGWRSSKTMKAVKAAVGRILSPRLRGVISAELLKVDTSGLSDRKSETYELSPREYIDSVIRDLVDENPPVDTPCDTPSDTPCDTPSDTPCDTPSDGVSRSGPLTHALANANANANAPARERTTTRAHQLPDDWQPKPETVAAMSAAMPGVDFRLEHAKFRDHYKSSGKAMKDWDATWRNWMRRVKEFAPTSRASTRQQETDDLFAAAARRMGVTPQPLHNHLTIEGTVA